MSETTSAFQLTQFKNKQAASFERIVMTDWELCDLIWSTHALTKDSLPWLKLATFGDKKTKKGSLRHDDNVETITGIELDYDREELAFESAVKRLRKAQLQFLIYTSPSYTDARPRWRALLRTSEPLPPDKREQLVKRVNGVLGGVISDESFTLSQSYYYGRVGEQSMRPRCEYYSGDYIDQRPDLDAGAIGKQKDRAKAKTKTGAKRSTFEDHLASMGDGDGLLGFNGPLCSASSSYAASHGPNFDRAELKRVLREAINRAPKNPNRPNPVDHYLDDDYLDPLIELAVGKFASDTTDDTEVKRLAGLSPVLYDRERDDAAKRLGIRAATLDKLVQAARPVDDDNKQGHAISFPDPEPWPEPVDGAQLLDAVAEAIGAYVVMPPHCADTAALWVAHSYLLDRFLVSPRLAISSPTKQCGKTTLLDVLTRLVLRPLPTANVTAAAVFRVVEGYRPALLVDEADTFLRDNDELRGVINSGHRKGGSVLRTVGDDHEPRAFATYSPCAIALIGRLPDTLHDRSVVIDLKRRLPSETIKPFRSDRTEHLDVLARQAARWARDHAEEVGASDPEMPTGVFNRVADNWRGLLAIADAAGGDWPERARKALKEMKAASDDESNITMLLADIEVIFAEKDSLPSADLVEALVEIESRPWAEFGKSRKPITQNRLARLLRPLGIVPDNVRVGGKVPKGYQRHQFKDAWERYLAAAGAFEPLQRYNASAAGTSGSFQTATQDSDVAVAKCEKPNNDGPCSGVAVAKEGLSERDVDALADEVENWAYGLRDQAGEIDERRLRAEIRRRLQWAVFPEWVEAEAERVLRSLFERANGRVQP